MHGDKNFADFSYLLERYAIFIIDCLKLLSYSNITNYLGLFVSSYTLRANFML